MTGESPDPSAPLEHAEILSARLTMLPLAEMGGVIIRAAETVMTMQQDELCRPYAQEYIGRMLDYLHAWEKSDGAKRAADQRQAEFQIALIYLQSFARATMHYDYCGIDLISDDDSAPPYDPVVAKRAAQGMTVADVVLARAVRDVAAQRRPEV